MKKSFTQKFVDLPDAQELGIAAVIAFVVGVLFQNLAELVPFFAFLVQYASVVAGAISLAVIKWLENALPDKYPEISILAIKLLLAVFAAFEFAAKLVVSGFLAF
jgi:hypothetical protein